MFSLFTLFDDFGIVFDFHDNFMMRSLKLLRFRIHPIPLHGVIIALGNIVSTLVALSTEASRVICSGLMLAFPSIRSVTDTAKVTLVTHESGLVLSGIMLTMFYHGQISHDLLKLE